MYFLNLLLHCNTISAGWLHHTTTTSFRGGGSKWILARPCSIYWGHAQWHGVQICMKEMQNIGQAMAWPAPPVPPGLSLTGRQGFIFSMWSVYPSCSEVGTQMHGWTVQRLKMILLILVFDRFFCASWFLIAWMLVLPTIPICRDAPGFLGYSQVLPSLWNSAALSNSFPLQLHMSTQLLYRFKCVAKIQ